jgi:hypothetical protein
VSPALIVATRFVVALSLLGSVLVQAVVLPLVWVDLAGETMLGRVIIVTIAALSIFCLQVVGICIWRMLTLVRGGLVLSAASLRSLNVTIGAIITLSVLVVVLAVALAPGEAAPGIVGLLCGVALVIAGASLVVAVIRGLLVQAIRA